MKSLRVIPALVAALVVAGSALAADARPRVLAIEFDNDVNPVTADYVVSELERAEEEGYAAAVIVLDTPGGLSEAMRDIYQKELDLELPVIAYVPTGARAASAGVWIMQAADIAAMAPQSNLGSSTPVSATGGEIPSDLRKKVVNDAAASLRALAEEHGRNGDWAEQAVRNAANVGARRALELNVIDAVATDLPTLLEEIDGRRTVPKGIVLDTAGAEIVTVEMSAWKKALDLLIDPNIIALMLSIGLIGLVVELWNPGLIFPGTVGAVSLIVGLFGLQVLPISWAGVLLLLLAVAFFVAELVVTSHGALALAGAVCFVIGALMLFDPAGPAYQVTWPVAVAIAGTIGLFVVFALTKVVQARRAPAFTGQSTLVGTTGVVRREGFVLANGELWRTAGGEGLRPGTPVRITAVDDALRVSVEPVPEQGSVGSPA